jgi:hypothetical protein
MEEYLPKATVSEEKITVTTKKRKKAESNKQDTTELKARARLFCKSPEQWRSVSKKSHDALKVWLEDQEFNQQTCLHQSIFSFAHQLYSLVVDKITLGNEHVRIELENDLTLRHAIEVEGQQFASLMNNKMKIITLTLVDIFNGKKNQTLHEPRVVEILEVNGDEQIETSPGDNEAIVIDTINTDEHDHDNVDNAIITGEDTKGDEEN